MARPPRRAGLGSPGLERIRRELGTPLEQDSNIERVFFPEEEEYVPPYVIHTKNDVENAYAIAALGFSFEDDFEVFNVAKSDVEGRGPQFSTRVASHQFIPSISWDDIYSLLQTESAQLYPVYVTGLMYVTWHKRSKNHSGTEYYGINLAEYREFSKSNSKGRDVRNFESSFANV